MLPSSHAQQPPPLPPHQPPPNHLLHHHNRSQSLQQPSDQLKRAQAYSNQSQHATSSSSLGVISSILTQLSQKYRVTQQPQYTFLNFDQKLDELKGSFLFMEQQHPGATDTFVKNIFQILSPNNVATANGMASGNSSSNNH
jgi:hypothetical protein